MKLVIRLSILLALLAGLFYFVVRSAGRGQVEALGEALGPVAFLEHYKARGSFDGYVDADNVQLIMNRQHILDRLYFDNWRMQTPGLGHLLNTPFGTPEQLPEQFTIETEGVRGVPHPLLDHQNRVWLNFKSWVPFDAYGCRNTGEFIEADFAAMELGRRRTSLDVSYQKLPQSSKFDITWDNLDFPSVRLEMELENFDLEQWLSSGFSLSEAALLNVRLSLAAGDYPKKRTAWCAKDRGVSEDEFLNTNESMVNEFLNAVGLAAEPRLMDRWRKFNREGGSVVMSANYGQAVKLADLRGKKLAEVFDKLKLRIKTDGSPDIPLRLTDFVLPDFEVAAQLDPEPVPSSEQDPELSADADASPSIADLNPLAGMSTGKSLLQVVTPKSADAAIVKPVVPVRKPRAGPRAVAFSELASLKNRIVTVYFRNGKRYRGRVLSASAGEVELRVNLEGGTANVKLKSQQISKIEVGG